MSEWKAVILVPKLVDIEYARDVSTAESGAEALIRKIDPVRLSSGEGYENRFEPKLCCIVGPEDQIESRRRKLANLRGGPESRNPKGPASPSPFADGPDAA